MNRHGTFLAIALAAVLAVATATAGQLVVVSVEVVKSNREGGCIPFSPSEVVETGTTNFRVQLQRRSSYTRDFGQRECRKAGVKKISI